MTANVARVTLTGYIMYFSTRNMPRATYHTVEGLLMMGFGLSLLRAECWVLDRLIAPAAAGRRADGRAGRRRPIAGCRRCRPDRLTRPETDAP